MPRKRKQETHNGYDIYSFDMFRIDFSFPVFEISGDGTEEALECNPSNFDPVTLAFGIISGVYAIEPATRYRLQREHGLIMPWFGEVAVYN